MSLLLAFLDLQLLTQILGTFRPEVQMPYKAIPGTAVTEINAIGSTLTCDQQRNSLQDCATECYDRSLTTTGCPGFYTDTTQSNICYLCHVSNKTEVEANSHTTFGNNDILYLLKDNEVPPEVSVNFDDYMGNTIYGTNVNGTTINVVSSDHVDGIKGEGLYLHDGGKVRLTGSGTECWTNLLNCTSGMTVSIWYKPSILKYCYIVASGSQFQQGFSFRSDDTYTDFWIDLPTGRNRVGSDTVLIVGRWFLLTGTFHDIDGLSFSINGVRDHGTVAHSATAIDEVDWRGHIGVKDDGGYTAFPVDGTVDEFKYYYKVLNTVEIWREYVGYDLDLDRPVIIPSPDLVSIGNDYTKLVDGNLATCVPLNQDSCKAAMKVKLWNSASDKTNFTVTVVTENLECHHKELMVYGGQDLRDGLPETIPEEKMHFLGKHKELKLDSESVVNGQKECVFKPTCGGVYYDVVISVQNVPDEASWKICEVLFN